MRHVLPRWPTALACCLCGALSTLPGQLAWRRAGLYAHPGAGVAHDPGRAQTLLFGDWSVQPHGTWAWTGERWTEVFTKTQPLVNAQTNSRAMVYDAARKRIVMLAFPWDIGTFWEWDGTDWLARPGLPGSAAFAVQRSMACDTARGRVLVFGGNQYAGWSPIDEMWSWDGAAWTLLNPPAKPSARVAPAMAYDEVRARVVLFGGGTLPPAAGQETWEWDGTTWLQVASGVLPAWNGGDALAWDPSRARVVRYSAGSSAALHEWTGSAWLAVGAGPGPTLGQPVLTFETVRGRLLLHGWVGSGQTPASETWELVGSTWVRRHVGDPPPSGGGMVYDTKAQEVQVFGASGGTITFDPVGWDGQHWIRRTSASTPPWRAQFGLAHDGRTLVLGGDAGLQQLGDMWAWDGAAWTQLAPAVLPPGRSSPAMAYDLARGKTLLFGGNRLGVGSLGDTWEWDGVIWTQRNPATSPPASSGPLLMSCDLVRARMVLLSPGQVWEWDGATWSKPAAQPPFNQAKSMTYDWSRHRILVNTWGSGVFSTQTWEWTGTAWNRIVAEVPGVAPEWLMAWDIRRARAVACGVATWELVPDHPPSAVPFGAACAGTRGSPLLTAATLPWLGEGFVVGLPYASPAAVIAGASRTAWGSVPLPWSLASSGMPGCSLHASLDIALPFAGNALVLPMPSRAELVGVPLYLQGICADPGANLLGAVTSNALEVRAGDR